MSIEGYTLISRLDRRDGRSCAGVAVFASDFDASRNTFLFHLSHTNELGCSFALTEALPCWDGATRLPSREVDIIVDLKAEILEHCRFALGVISVGDMNVHERSWLKFSTGISAEGRSRNIIRPGIKAAGWCML